MLKNISNQINSKYFNNSNRDKIKSSNNLTKNIGNKISIIQTDDTVKNFELFVSFSITALFEYRISVICQLGDTLFDVVQSPEKRNKITKPLKSSILNMPSSPV